MSKTKNIKLSSFRASSGRNLSQGKTERMVKDTMSSLKIEGINITEVEAYDLAEKAEARFLASQK